MWNGKSVAVILPTYNECDSIREVIKSFEAIESVDEVIVVNNNAAEGTSEQVASTSAIEIYESVQGYGSAIQRGFNETQADIVTVFEPDGTFIARDIIKLLAYSDDFDVVYGSRTVKEFIWEGANMGIFLKWGNYAVAKMMEMLFNTTSLTDVGCTVRCIHRSSLEEIKPFFTVKGSFFGPEMMLLSLLRKQTVIQIPVNYTKRIGTSSVTGNPTKAFVLGLQMIGLILRYRWRGWFKPERFSHSD
jgi:glycosyltransferase involved in cell wall biosynthesis